LYGDVICRHLFLTSLKLKMNHPIESSSNVLRDHFLVRGELTFLPPILPLLGGMRSMEHSRRNAMNNALVLQAFRFHIAVTCHK
jgi:hypothetical protein